MGRHVPSPSRRCHYMVDLNALSKFKDLAFQSKSVGLYNHNLHIDK